MIKELKKFYVLWKYNLKAESALRQSFLMLMFGMMINDIAFVLVWVFFFQKFGGFNGWQMGDVLGLQAMAAATYGIGYMFAGGADKLPLMIDSGYFDNLLLTPGNLHLKILASAIRPSALGDMLYGIIVSIIYFIVVPTSVLNMVLWFLVMIPGGIIIANFALFGGLVAFWINDANTIAMAVKELITGPSLYPSAVYNNVLRFIFIYIIPSIVIGSLPVEAIKNNNYWLILLAWVLAVFWICFTNLCLRIALRHYESANLLANRV